MTCVRSVVLAVGASLLPSVLLAQVRPRVSFDASAGLGVIEAERTHNDHVGVAVEGLLGWRLRQKPGQTAVLALSAGTQGSVASTAECEPAPGDGCTLNHSRFHTLAALVGWEGGFLFGAPLRILSGLAYYHARSNGGLGLQGRVDLSTPALRRARVVASLRAGSPFERVDGRAYRIGAVAAGIRIQ